MLIYQIYFGRIGKKIIQKMSSIFQQFPKKTDVSTNFLKFIICFRTLLKINENNPTKIGLKI